MKRERLEGAALIDRSRPVRFTFDGRELEGFEGDTLAAALLAQGIRPLGRSFKMHRPRGLLSAGLEEPNALVTLIEGADRRVNLRATEIPLYDGLVARSQNNWPGVRWDMGALLGAFAWMLPAGFYYKTFMWPSWNWYEGLVRRLSGGGRLVASSVGCRYASVSQHCDTLVIGAGPAGLAAACAAASRREDVILLDADSLFGGSALSDAAPIEGVEPRSWIQQRLADLAAAPNVRMLSRTVAFGYYQDNLVAAVEQLPDGHPLRERIWKIRARRVILATGAIERPLVFTNNDRPGVMLAGAVRVYVRRYAVSLARQAVVFTNNDSAYETAFALCERGIAVRAIVDLREHLPGALTTRARTMDIHVLARHAVVDTRGRSAIRSVAIAEYDSSSGQCVGQPMWVGCDLLCMSGGWSPTVHLYSQAGGLLRYDSVSGSLLPESGPGPVECVGAAAGAVVCAQTVTRIAAPGSREKRHLQWVDFTHDVTVRDIEVAALEGFRSVEHMKRYTTGGMGVDQGKTGNLNAISILGETTGRAPGQVGVTTFRPPFHPVTIGALAGARVDELAQRFRHLPVSSHEREGGVCEDHAGWLRPAYYGRSGESAEAAILREARTARQGVVLFDSSSLGKIEVLGPDSAEFLDRLYVNNVRTLEPGQLRYGLMLNDGGVILDDGVMGCLAADHYLVNTSSSGALTVYAGMQQWLQCEWPDLRVWLANQTAQWATLTLSGPRSRDVLARLDLPLDLSEEAFPHMRIRLAQFEGLPLRVRRASFIGELSYEIDVAADQADTFWARLLQAGAPEGIAPLGMEALDVLRVEKGYFEVGVDTDPDTSPLDVGWGAAIARKERDFVGRRSLLRAAMQATDRFQLVGLALEAPDVRVPVGTHAVNARGEVEGFVTSSCHSPHLNRCVALALIRSGLARTGESISLSIAGGSHAATLVERCFYDPRGDRLHGR